MNKQTVGIIGLGGFGTFCAGVLAKDRRLTVIATDKTHKQTPKGVVYAPFNAVAKADIIILAVPLEAYTHVLPRLRPLVPTSSLVIDICSVKTSAENILLKELPAHANILLSHPLFGPQSAAKGTAGHTLVITKQRGKKAAAAIEYCESRLGLNIIRLTSKQHDKAMAEVQALTFFVARGLTDSGVGQAPFQTPSYRMLLDLVALDRTHSNELFETIQLGNPYAREVRQKFITNLKSIATNLDQTALIPKEPSL